jgi:glycosyltransferase involved in cell wall biosynthesis
MHIAYDAKRFFHNSSGLGNYARDLVRIMATLYPENTYNLYAKKVGERGADICRLPNVKTFLPSVALPLWRQMQMGIDAQLNNAEVFHGTSGELPRLWNKKSIKKVVSICDVIFERYPQYYSSIDRKIHFNKFVHAGKKADVVVAISQQTKQDCMEFLKIPEHKIQVVYLACHPAMQHTLNILTADVVKKKFLLPEKFILNVGTIEERKNVLNIVKAIKGTSIPLVVVGRKTDYYQTVMQYIVRYNMEGQIYFLENVSMEELSVMYKLATTMVYPSRFEGFGLPIIESLFSETPVITTFNSCFPEVAGPDSLFVNPESSDEIKTQILKVWNDASLCNVISQKGLMHAQQFKDEPIAKQWMEIYSGK